MGRVEQEQFEVVGGPSKFDLLIALSFRKYPPQDIILQILDTDGRKRQISAKVVLVTSLKKREDDGKEGHWWRIIGYSNDLRPPQSVHVFLSCILIEYSTKLRTGWIRELTSKEREQTKFLGW